jgi:signal transduction histidine kinase
MNPVSDKLRELEQENTLLETITDFLESEIRKLQNPAHNHEKNELEQQNILLDQINSFILDNNQKSLDNVFSIISHELRTPLVPIKTYSQMLLDGKFGTITQVQMAKLNVICTNVSTLEEIIRNSIDSKKIESGMLVPKLEKNDIVSIFVDAKKHLIDQLNKKEITVSIPAERYFVRCDLDLMKRVFVEIIKNSISAIPRGGNIILSVLQLNDNIQIDVSDNGYGIPKNKISEILSKLYQTDMSSTRENSGLGMGLFLCKQIVDAHGGALLIQSDVGHGTTVKIVLKP